MSKIRWQDTSEIEHVPKADILSPTSSIQSPSPAAPRRASNDFTRKEKINSDDNSNAGKRQHRAQLLESNGDECKIRWECGRETQQVPQDSVSPFLTQKQQRRAKDMKDPQPKRCKTSAQRRKEESQRASLLGLEFTDCPDTPTIKFIRANAQRKQAGQQWLQKIRQDLQAQEQAASQIQAGGRHRRTSKQELYAEHKKGFPPPHIYQNVVFCDKAMLPESCTHIRVLTDSEFKKNLDSVRDYNDFLHATANDAVDAIHDMAEFQGAAIRSMVQEEGKSEWHEKLERREDVFNALDLLEEEEDEIVLLQGPFKYTFRGVTFHDQTPGTESRISAYYKHKDKLGNIVGFCPLSGESYNFVALQSSKPTTKLLNGNKKEQAKLEQHYGSFKLYHSYKTTALSDERSMIEKFEADFLKEATRLGLPRVRVYKLCAGDKLAFTAADYLHGTIIPKSNDGTCRALLVFHDLIPYGTFAY